MKILILLSLSLLLNIEIFATSSVKVMLTTVDGGISPATETFIGTTINEAIENEYQLYVLKLNTPGGLLESTRKICGSMMKADIPILVYVSPSGSRAGSAGVFITMAADIAAMAPGTNIGSAHPVSMGSEMDSIMSAKVTNDALAFIRSIAEQNNRNADWAQDAVSFSISATAQEALEKNVVDYVAKDIDDLFKQIGSIDIVKNSNTYSFDLQDTQIEVRDMNWMEELLSTIADPNVAYIFVLLAGLGFMLELYNPGSIFPGSVGALSALLAAYSLQMMPVNYIGLGLLLLSMIFVFLEIKIASYGLLGLAALVCFIMGSIMLIDNPQDFEVISHELIYSIAAALAIVLVVYVLAIIKSQKSKNAVEQTIEQSYAYALENIDLYSTGQVKYNGEIWRAISDSQIEKDSKLKVVDISGLTLKVERAE